MENKSSLPVPNSATTAAKKAKSRDMPVGGAPPISLSTDMHSAQERARVIESDEKVKQAMEWQSKTSGREPSATPGQMGKRSQEETANDIKTALGVMQKESYKEPEKQEENEAEGDPISEDKSSYLSDLDEFEWEKLRKETDKSDFNRPELKIAIEKRCRKISVEEMVMSGFTTQDVPIIPGKLEVRFQTIRTEDDLKIKQSLFSEEGSDRYIMDKYGVMNLALGLVSINKYPLPDHKDSNGDYDEELFKRKLSAVMRYALPLIGIMSVNFYWFDTRVRKSIHDEALGNG
jgi:hypothetical protein